MNKFSAFALGALVGASAALALAPKTGEEMRDIASQTVNDIKEGCSDAMKDILGEDQQPNEEELRAKIEEARQRIAKLNEEGEEAETDEETSESE